MSLDSPFKLLVLDLDGTTLHGPGLLGEKNIAAAHALQAHGVDVTLNTGRLFSGTQWVAHKLGVDGSVSVVNGAELIDTQTGVAHHGDYLQRESRLHAQSLLREFRLTTFVFASRTIHYDRAAAHHSPYLGVWTTDLEAHEDIHLAPAWERDDIVALCAIGENAAIDALQTRLHDELPDEVGTFRFDTHDGHGFLKLRHQGLNKGSALVRLAEERGYTPDQTVAVGDWLNDLPMFETAGRSFAMGHSTDAIKEAAGEVLDADRDTGGAVAEVARRVWGIEV